MLLAADMASYCKIVLCLVLGFIPTIPASGHEIGFFFLKDKKVSAIDALKVPLETMVLEDKPFWTTDSFQEYRCPTHEFKLSDEATAAIPLVESVSGVPFVLKVSKKIVYLGAFFSLFSSEVFPNPVIDATLPATSGKTWTLYRAYPHEGFGRGADPRSIPELMDELRTQGKLVEECPTK
jgi:hypothetical protein